MPEFHGEPSFTNFSTVPNEDKVKIKNIIKASDIFNQQQEDAQLEKWLGPEIFAIAQKMKKEKEEKENLSK